MGLDVIYVHVKTNDVLATSFSAMHGGKFRDGECAIRSARGRPLLADLDYAPLRRERDTTPP